MAPKINLKKTPRTAWFNEARFGLFIHWSLDAMPARHERFRHHERIRSALSSSPTS